MARKQGKSSRSRIRGGIDALSYDCPAVVRLARTQCRIFARKLRYDASDERGIPPGQLRHDAAHVHGIFSEQLRPDKRISSGKQPERQVRQRGRGSQQQVHISRQHGVLSHPRLEALDREDRRPAGLSRHASLRYSGVYRGHPAAQHYGK